MLKFGRSKSVVSGKTVDEAFSDLVRVFQTSGHSFRSDEQTRVIRFSISGRNGEFLCLAGIAAQGALLQTAVRLPLHIPRAKLLPVSEFFHRASAHTIAARFDLDFDTGMCIAWACAPLVPAGKVSECIVQHCICSALTAADEFLPFLLMVLKGDSSPKSAAFAVKVGMVSTRN